MGYREEGGRGVSDRERHLIGRIWGVCPFALERSTESWTCRERSWDALIAVTASGAVHDAHRSP